LNRTKDEYFTRGLVEDCTLKFLGVAAWTAVERIGSKGKPTHSRRSTQKPQSAQNSFLFCEFSESRVECRLKSFECVQNRPANFWRARPSTSLRTGALVGLPWASTCSWCSPWGESNGAPGGTCTRRESRFTGKFGWH